jgi:hypothetical protein
MYKNCLTIDTGDIAKYWKPETRVEYFILLTRRLQSYFIDQEQWWPTFFEPRYTLRVRHDQNRVQRAIHDIFQNFWWHTDQVD